MQYIFDFRYSTTAMVQTSAYSLALGRHWTSEPHLLTNPPYSTFDSYSPSSFQDRLDNFNQAFWDILNIGHLSIF